MKARDSGMPELIIWEQFFNPSKTLTILGLNNTIGDVAEFGCGYGTFTIPAAKMIHGNIYALDIEPDMIQITQKEAEKNKLDNVRTVLRDFVENGTGLPDKSVDYTMLFNILHIEEPIKLLSEAKRILRKGGKLAIIHWNYDPLTPRGPSMDIRPKPGECKEWALSAGFSDPKEYDLKPFHYGILLTNRQ